MEKVLSKETEAALKQGIEAFRKTPQGAPAPAAAPTGAAAAAAAIKAAK